MRIDDHHRLRDAGHEPIPFFQSPHGGDPLRGGKPRFLILHYTAGGNAEGAVAWFRNPAAKASAHFVVDHDGTVVQMMPTDRVAWHAGRSGWNGIDGLNGYSVGIEIANWGLLGGKPGAWRSWLGVLVPDNRVMEAKHKAFDPRVRHGWEVFDEAQLRTVIAVGGAVAARYGIPPENVLGHDDIAPVRKQDPGPAFPMERVRAALFGRRDNGDGAMRVASAAGLNLRSGPGSGFPVLETLADGCRVEPLERRGNWVHVAVPGGDGRTGFVHRRWLA